MPSTVAIEIRDLVKTYGTGDVQVRALDGVDFDAVPGEFVAIMGRRGPERARCCTSWERWRAPRLAACG